MRSLLRILLGIVVGLILIALPLLIVVRAECGRGERAEYEWSLAPPLGELRRGCRNPQNGTEQLIEFFRGR